MVLEHPNSGHKAIISTSVLENKKPKSHIEYR
jgi:hypothetical protein